MKKELEGQRKLKKIKKDRLRNRKREEKRQREN